MKDDTHGEFDKKATGQHANYRLSLNSANSRFFNSMALKIPIAMYGSRKKAERDEWNETPLENIFRQLYVKTLTYTILRLSSEI